MIVADTNLIVHLGIRSEWTPVAEHIFDKDPEWHAPVLWRSEFRSTLASHMRAGLMTYEHALSAMEEAEQFMLDRGNHWVDSTAVLSLVAESNCSAYDCEFVALARHLRVPLITSDSQLLRNFPNRAFAPDQFLASPGLPTTL